MSLGNIIDKLHDKHGFTYTGTTEKTDFSTFAIRFKQINDFNSGIKDFSSDSKVIKFRSRLVDRADTIRSDFR